MKCDFKCFECEYEDCILSEEEASKQEDKKATYKSEFNVQEFKTEGQLKYESYKDFHKQYREAHKDKAKEYQKAYYEANKERIKDYNKKKQRSRYLMNTENEREKSRKYYQANREKILRKKAERRRLNELVDDTDIAISN